MNIRFVIFLVIVIAIVGALIYIEMGRGNPWDSDVFFSETSSESIYVTLQSPKST
jgi:hypothetical protein